MYIVVAYDIKDDHRRTKLARYLEGFGQRVQYSVFECELGDRHLRRLVAGIHSLVLPEDSVRVYRFATRKDGVILVLGGRQLVELARVTVA